MWNSGGFYADPLAERILPPAEILELLLMIGTLKKIAFLGVFAAILVGVGWLWYEEMLPFVNVPSPEIVGQVGYWDSFESEETATRFLVECSIRNTGRTSKIAVNAVISGTQNDFLREFADVAVPRNETVAHTFGFARADRLASRPARPEFECVLGSRTASISSTQAQGSITPSP